MIFFMKKIHHAAIALSKNNLKKFSNNIITEIKNFHETIIPLALVDMRWLQQTQPYLATWFRDRAAYFKVDRANSIGGGGRADSLTQNFCLFSD